MQCIKVVRWAFLITHPEYIQRGGDGYSVLKGSELLPHPKQSRFVLGIVMDYMLAKEHVAPKLEGRIVDSGHNEEL